MYTPSPGKPLDDQDPNNGGADSLDVATPKDPEIKDEVALAPTVINRKFHKVLDYGLIVVLTPFKLLCRGFGWATIWLLRSTGKKLVSRISAISSTILRSITLVSLGFFQ